VLRRDLAQASAGSAREIAADLRARFVSAADEPPQTLLDAQGRAMAVDHPHVRAIAVEPYELFRAFTETCVIVTSHAHVGLEQRKAANSAGEAVRNGRHLQSPYAMNARSMPS